MNDLYTYDATSTHVPDMQTDFAPSLMARMPGTPRPHPNSKTVLFCQSYATKSSSLAFTSEDVRNPAIRALQSKVARHSAALMPAARPPGGTPMVTTTSPNVKTTSSG